LTRSPHQPRLDRGLFQPRYVQEPRWAPQRKRISDLTIREYEVFALVGRGCDNHSIASQLGVNERTIKAHLTSILRKLSVNSRLQVGLVAAEHAVFDEDPPEGPIPPLLASP
jgi:DNA-binding NarL/FixJ family response regulator